MTYQQSTDLCQRRNMEMYLTVLIACNIRDIYFAARYMASYGVPFDVAHRVLMFPNQRRSAKA